MEMLNLLPLGTSRNLRPPVSTYAPQLLHPIVHPELLQSPDFPHCPVRCASKQKPGGKVLSQPSNIPLPYAFLIWKRKHRKALAFRKQVPPRKATLSHPHPPRGSHTTCLAHYWALLSRRSDELGRLAGMGTKGGKDRGEQRPQDTPGFQQARG